MTCSSAQYNYCTCQRCPYCGKPIINGQLGGGWYDKGEVVVTPCDYKPGHSGGNGNATEERKK